MAFRALAFGVLLLCSLLARAGEPLPAGVAVDASSAEAALVPWARIVKDPGQQMTVEALLRLPAIPAGHEGARVASFGYSEVTHWFSVAIENPGAAPLQRLLVFEPSWLDDVQVILIGPDGVRRSYRGGDRLPFAQRAIPHRQINFELTLPPGRSQLLVRTQTQDPYLVGMTLWERSAFFAADNREVRYQGLLYGAIGAMLLFNLVLFFSVREPIYAAYVAYVAAFIVMHATYNGHMYLLIWPDAPIWGNWAHSVFIYLFAMAGLFFAIHFLELRSKWPLAYRWASGLLVLIAASSVLTAVVGGYGLHVSSSILLAVVYTPFVLLLGIGSLLKGNRAARYFLTATVAGFAGSFVTALTVSGFIPFSFYTYRAVDFGMLIDAVLLSLALADRLRLARAEAEAAKARLIETTRAHAEALEATVAQRTLELRQANAAKDKFFSIVAHDLRGPIGSLSVLVNDVISSVDEMTDEILEIIRSTAKNTSQFLEELLTWARSQKGEIDCQPLAFDLRQVLEETQELFSAQARAKRIQLEMQVGSPCWVYADLTMTHTILRNLVSNALKFTESDGSVQVSLGLEGDFCRVQVGDTGVGMSAESLRSIFRLDVKPPSSRGTQGEPGTGLGLILCKEFVEKNGGAIGVQSDAGKGMTFWFTLPKAQALGIFDTRAILEKAASLKVLVAEDDALHRETSGKVLRDLGCALTFAVDGDEAVRLAVAGDFDLILMDIDMPKLSGVEATKRIRARGGKGRIVALSSYSQRDLGELAREARFNGYLDKPLSRDALARVLAGLFADPVA